MGLYSDKKDYEEIIKENISKAKLLYSLSNEEKEIVLKLLNEKEIIKEKNGLLAEYQLRKIDKKIEKIKNNSKNIKNKK